MAKPAGHIARSGFFIATGFSGHGFGIGPAAGRLVADLVTGGPPIADPTAFRFSRFTDGSRARPEAQHLIGVYQDKFTEARPDWSSWYAKKEEVS